MGLFDFFKKKEVVANIPNEETKKDEPTKQVDVPIQETKKDEPIKNIEIPVEDYEAGDASMACKLNLSFYGRRGAAQK